MGPNILYDHLLISKPRLFDYLKGFLDSSSTLSLISSRVTRFHSLSILFLLYTHIMFFGEVPYQLVFEFGTLKHEPTRHAKRSGCVSHKHHVNTSGQHIFVEFGVPFTKFAEQNLFHLKHTWRLKDWACLHHLDYIKTNTCYLFKWRNGVCHGGYTIQQSIRL